MHAVLRALVTAGDNVVVFGAGTIGLSVLQCAKAAGAGKVIVVELAKARKEYAQKLGAYAVFDPTWALMWLLSPWAAIRRFRWPWKVYGHGVS